MSVARFLVGDVRARQAELIAAGDRFDFLLCSPPFYVLRSYLPDSHPDKALEIGSEASVAEYIGMLLQLTADSGRLLAPHGSIAIELGDTYADGDNVDEALAKSLLGIPALYQTGIIYGRNPVSGAPSPAGRWRVRNLKAWIRSNPPVGALGDKERPATSYIIVACRARDRWFDLDAVRTAHSEPDRGHRRDVLNQGAPGYHTGDDNESRPIQNAGGAPPRDWWHHTDAVLQAELDLRARDAGKPVSHSNRKTNDLDGHNGIDPGKVVHDTLPGAQGHHLRRALEHAGILHTPDVHDISPRGYSGAHYAVWPPELVRQLVDEMCPRRVCSTCGEPSRRITESDYVQLQATSNPSARGLTAGVHAPGADPSFAHGRANRMVTTVGWSDCGHNTWRPGRVLDPFVGSGTTLAVTSGMGRDAVGIDLDYTNAGLAMDRVGMWLDIDWGPQDFTLPALGAGDPSGYPWITDQAAEAFLAAVCGLWASGIRGRAVITATHRPARPRVIPAQTGPGLFD